MSSPAAHRPCQTPRSSYCIKPTPCAGLKIDAYGNWQDIHRSGIYTGYACKQGSPPVANPLHDVETEIGFSRVSELAFIETAVAVRKFSLVELVSLVVSGLLNPEDFV